MGKLATSPLPYRGSPPLQSRGQNQKWPTSGRNGYLTPAVLGIPTAAERGAKSEVAHKWANWLPHPCRIGDPHRCRAGGKIRNGPQVGKLATSPLPYRGAPPLQSGGQNQKWPTSGQIGYLTPAVLGIPTAAEQGAKSEVAHKWAKWLPHPCRIGEPHCCRAGGRIRSGPQMGKLATSPLPYRGAPPLQSRGQNQKWPTSGQGGYLTPAVLGIPTAAERGAKSEVAHKWANWLPHPCRIGDPHRCRAGGKIRSGPQMGKLATSPLPYRGSPPLQSRGQNQKWPTSGQIGYLTPAVSGSPTAAERGAKSEVAHKWANWLPHPCRIGDPHRCRAGGKIRSGPQVGKLATSPLPYRGSPPLQSRGQNQKWPTSGQIGYLTLAVSGSPTAAERGAKSEVAHKWARWLHNPCRFFFCCKSCNFFFFAVNACNKKIVRSCNFFFCCKSCNFLFFAVNARNKKTVRSCNFFFFAVSRVSRLTRLTAGKKKLHDYTVFLLRAFTAKKKNYTNYNIHHTTPQIVPEKPPRGFSGTFGVDFWYILAGGGGVWYILRQNGGFFGTKWGVFWYSPAMSLCKPSASSGSGSTTSTECSNSKPQGKYVSSLNSNRTLFVQLQLKKKDSSLTVIRVS